MPTTVNASNATSRPRPTIDPVFLDFWYKSHWLDFGFRIVFVLIALVLTIVGLVAIYRLRGSRPYGSVSILYSMFLCLLVNKLTVMVFDIVQWGHLYHWSMGDALCRIHSFFDEAMEGAIAYQLVIVSGYMVLAIKKPGWTQRLDTKKGAAIFLGVFWFLVVAFNAEAFGAHTARNYGSFTACWGRSRSRRHRMLWIYGYLIIILYVPWFLLVGMAGYLYYYNRSQAALQIYRTDGGSGGTPRDNFRLSLSFAVLFTVCKGPYTIYGTRLLLGYWSWHGWNIAFWFTMDVVYFLQDIYSTLLPLFFLLLLPDLHLEARGLLYHVTGRAPPTYSKEFSHKTGTDDETNLV